MPKLAVNLMPDGDGWRPIAKMAAAIILVQLVFWLLVKPVLFDNSIHSADYLPISGYQAAKVEGPGYPDPAAVNFRDIESLPHEECCEIGYWAFRHQVEIGAVPPTGLGYIPNNYGDNFRIFVNGSQAFGNGEMQLPDITYHGNTRDIIYIPAGLLREGANEFSIVMVRDGVPYFDFKEPRTAEYGNMMDAWGWKAFLLNRYKLISTVVGFLLSAFAFIILLRSEKKAFAFWTFVLMFSWATNSAYYLWPEMPFHGKGRMIFYFTTALLVPFAWFAWADSWSRRKLPYALILGSVTFLILLAAMVVGFYALPRGEGFDLADSLLNYGGISFAILTFGRLLWGFWKSADDRVWEAAIAVLLVTLLALQLLNEAISSVNLGYLSRSQPIILLAFALAFFTRNIRLFASAEQIQKRLQSELDVRTAELEAAHDRERIFIRKEAHDDERKRLMQDMHDGMGSTLMSMLLAARRGKSKPDDVAKGLESVIDELRLIINSMDSVGGSMAGALSTFRERIQPKAEAAGFQLIWHQECDDLTSDLGPRDILNIYRILQEAVTNAFKHSKGDKILVALSCEHKNRLEIRISDNGAGMNGAKQKGKGIANMKTRAERVGADFEIRNDAPGVTVHLGIPLCGAEDRS